MLTVWKCLCIHDILGSSEHLGVYGDYQISNSDLRKSCHISPFQTAHSRLHWCALVAQAQRQIGMLMLKLMLCWGAFEFAKLVVTELHEWVCVWASWHDRTCCYYQQRPWAVCMADITFGTTTVWKELLSGAALVWKYIILWTDLQSTGTFQTQSSLFLIFTQLNTLLHLLYLKVWQHETVIPVWAEFHPRRKMSQVGDSTP